MNDQDDFQCPACHASFKVVRVAAPPNSPSAVVACTECDFPLVPYDGDHILKYFQTAPARLWRAE